MNTINTIHTINKITAIGSICPNHFDELVCSSDVILERLDRSAYISYFNVGGSIERLELSYRWSDCIKCC